MGFRFLDGCEEILLGVLDLWSPTIRVLGLSGSVWTANSLELLDVADVALTGSDDVEPALYPNSEPGPLTTHEAPEMQRALHRAVVVVEGVAS